MAKSDTSAARPEAGTDQPPIAVYRTGAAARLAGIPVETLRVWERRYRVAGPTQTAGGQRRYTPEQVRRLSLIKQLVELGNPVSALASLPDEALAEMRATARAISAAARGGPPRTGQAMRAALVGESFAHRPTVELLRNTGVDVARTTADIARAEDTLQDADAEVLVVELPALLEDTAEQVERARKASGAPAAVVLYRFARRDAIRRLRQQGYVVARMPLDPAEIGALCVAALAAHPREAAAEPAPDVHAARFDDSSLAELARASSTIYCECPRHLAELLRMLGSFERYSAECQNRSREDAALHRDLGRTAAEARSLLEEALLRVARAEGIPLPRRAGDAP